MYFDAVPQNKLIIYLFLPLGVGIIRGLVYLACV